MRKRQIELTPKEQEVLEELGLGLSNKEIAEKWGWMPTVKHHITHLREKLGAADRTQAVIIAYKKGLIQLDEF